MAKAPARPSDLGRAADGAPIAPISDFLLRLLELGGSSSGSVIHGLLMMTMLSANAEPISHHPELAWRYADAASPPPDELRVPVSIGEIARV